MTPIENSGQTNDESIEDGLSAPKRLANSEGNAGGDSIRDSSPEDRVVEAIPEWLELLLAKYGEQASMLVGIEAPFLSTTQIEDAGDSGPISQESAEVASLLEQMAAASESEPPSDQPASSVDWGKPERLKDDEIQDEAPDWLSQITQSTGRPPTAPISEETPEWLSEISDLKPEAYRAVDRPEGIEFPPDVEEVPDWLQDLTSSEPESKEPQVEERPLEFGDEVPDWMKELGKTVPETKPSMQEGAPSAPEGEEPDWLRDLDIAVPHVEEVPKAGEVTESPPPKVSETEGVEEEIPDWLAKLAEGTVPTPEPSLHEKSIEPAPAEPEAEVPEWLDELESVEQPPQVEPTLIETRPVPPAEVPAADAIEPEEEVPDWLRQLESIEVPPPAEGEPPRAAPLEELEGTPVEPEAEVPDWLRQLGSIEGPPPVEPAPGEPPPTAPPEELEGTPVEPEAEIPDWLRQLESIEESPTPEPPLSTPPETVAEVPAETGAEIPDWLASLREEEPSPLEMISGEETPEETYLLDEVAEEPAWLAELRSEVKPDLLELEEGVVEAEEEVLPDWLAELKSTQAASEMLPARPEVLEEPPEELEMEIPPAEFPPLDAEPEFPGVAEFEALPVEAEPEPGEEEDALDWLAEIEAAAEVPDYTPAADVEEEPAPEEEIPDWLRQMPPADLIPEAGKPETERETIETRRPPEWLVAESLPGAGDEEGDVAPPTEEAAEIEEMAPVVEDAVPADVPDWVLELKPEEAQPARPDQAISAEEDVLAGIPGLLPIADEEPEAEEEPVATLRSRLGMPLVPDVEGAELFKEIAESPVETAKDKLKVEAKAGPISRRGGIIGTLAWALVFIVLIVAIALTLLAVLNRMGDLLGGPAFDEFFGSPLVIDPAPVNTFRAQVTRLPPDAVVVVSFDYSPATEAEMGLLAKLILGDLLASQARIIAVSLRPEGAMMAQNLLEQYQSEYPYGERTLNLGYLPGQTAGVRSLAFLSSAPLYQDWTQILGDYPGWKDVEGLGDVALVVSVADSPLAIRWWVEQIGPGTQANRPMMAAVSAAADPSVRPYFNQLDPKSGQLLGLLSGVTDAAAYENRLGQPGRAVGSLAALSVAHLGVVVVSLGGTVVGFRTQANRE